jgi:hypothetical protein
MMRDIARKMLKDLLCNALGSVIDREKLHRLF